MKGYLANGLFSVGDTIVNDVIAREVRNRHFMLTKEELELFVPQEQDINDKSGYADSKAIYQADMEALMDSDFLIAVIDGVEIDSGVACEIGMFSTTGKPIFALYTDIRLLGTQHPQKLDALMKDSTENQFMYRNLFVLGAIKSNGIIKHSISSLIAEVVEFTSFGYETAEDLIGNEGDME